MIMMRRAFAFCLLGAVSCGLWPAEPAPPFPSDGISAFGGVEPVEVCLGSARIVAPALATGAAALCVPEGLTPALCAADGDCVGIERCICGRCVVEPCQGAGSCPGDLVCRGKRCTSGCGVDADCKVNERCVAGGCAKSCGNDADCHFGERCDSLDDVCVTFLCGGGGTCGASGACEVVAEIADLEEPTFLDQEPIVFVAMRRGVESAIYQARIDSAERYSTTTQSPVLVLPGEPRVSAPSVVRRGNTLELYAEAGNPSRIIRALSTDNGLSFLLDADPLLDAELPWEQGAVGSPSVFDYQGRTWMFYEGGAGAGIGLAEITAGKASRAFAEPVIRPPDVEDPIFWRGISYVGAPFATVVDGVVRVVFTAYGVEGFSASTEMGALLPDANDSIGLATTTDLKNYSFFPTGPMFGRVVNLRVYLGERDASFRIGEAGAEMLFVSSDATGENTTGLYWARGRGAF